MPVSQLYTNAVNSLGPDLASWEQTAQLINAVVGRDPRNQNGSDTLDIIQSEHQLSSDPPNADPVLMREVLLALANASLPASDGPFGRVYEQVIAQYALNGLPISSRPAMLFRYLGRPGVFELVADAMENAGAYSAARVLRRMVSDARNGRRTWDAVVRFLRRSAIWNSFPRSQVYLCGREAMFVTFEGSDSLPRTSAVAAHSALALWQPCNTCFLEVRYAPQPGDDLLYPTLADAGWFRYFRSAPATEPHGWTRPHDPQFPPQPEAVQRRVTFDRLASPDDLRALPH